MPPHYMRMYTVRKRFIGALILWKHLGEINNFPKTFIELMNATGLTISKVQFINFINQFIKKEEENFQLKFVFFC